MCNKEPHAIRVVPAIAAAILAGAFSLDGYAESTDTPKVEKTKVPEGRSVVDFYPANLTDDRKAIWRLSNDPVQYPKNTADRPRPLLELGDPFLGNGPIRPGIRLPTGQVIQPSFLLFGTFRSALQTFDDGSVRRSEWANRLDLNGNLNLSGTERLLFSLRPLDSQNGGYTGFNFEPDVRDGWREHFAGGLTRLYFEGDFGEMFPNLDPSDSKTHDLGFSVGRQRMQLQDGILINDIIDMAGITRNSLVFPGISNLRITGFYGWNHVNRGNNDAGLRSREHSADVYGLSMEADTALNNTISLDTLYVDDSHDRNAWYLGLASTQRFGGINSTFRVNASIPTEGESARVGRGVLLLSQLSTTLPNSDDLLYSNTFVNVGRFTSAARSPDQGGPLANLGILFGPSGMGRYRAPLGQAIDDTVGTVIGYQKFLDGIDKQLIVELGARTSMRGNRDEAEIGLGMRYQQSIGVRHVLRLDGFVGGREQEGLIFGVRTEWMIKF